MLKWIQMVLNKFLFDKQIFNQTMTYKNSIICLWTWNKVIYPKELHTYKCIYSHYILLHFIFIAEILKLN